MTELVVVRCGPGTTLQDIGRYGWQRFGLGPAGAMDRVAMAEANALVGNTESVGSIEFALIGGQFRVEAGRVRVALAGAEADLKIDGRLVALSTAITVDSGSIIDVGTLRGGLFVYLAVAGGFSVPLDLGAVATHVRAHVGGVDGRALRSWDRLSCNNSEVVGPDLGCIGGIKKSNTALPIRVILGPQADHFTDTGRATFLEATYTITPHIDRMGIRLTGPKIEHSAKGYNIVSDGIATGSIQVPGMGEPLVLLADRQTTGGYPKIATIITADLGRIAQMPPGTNLRFQAVSRRDAIQALVEQRDALAAFRARLRPAERAADLSSERLLGLNLVDGWTAEPT
jgi:5-oxoprolinase (ATP-hydrolysing) subunit C